jgi:hypothetical protein
VAIAFISYLANATSKTAGTLLETSFSSAVAGELYVVTIALDNTATTDGQTTLVSSVRFRDSGNVNDIGDLIKLGEFTNAQGAAGAGATVSVWYGIVPSGTWFLRVTHASVTARALQVHNFSVTSSLATTGTLQTLANDGADAGSMTIGSLTSREYLAIRGIAGEGPSATALTPTSGWTGMSGAVGTSGGSATTNMSVRGELRIQTATTFTSDPTSGIGAVDHASVLGVLYEVGGGPAPSRTESHNERRALQAVNRASTF